MHGCGGVGVTGLIGSLLCREIWYVSNADIHCSRARLVPWLSNMCTLATLSCSSQRHEVDVTADRFTDGGQHIQRASR